MLAVELYGHVRRSIETRVLSLMSVALFVFQQYALKTKNVLWQLPFAHARFSRKPYYDVRQVLGTRLPKSVALLVQAVK